MKNRYLPLDTHGSHCCLDLYYISNPIKVHSRELRYTSILRYSTLIVRRLWREYIKFTTTHVYIVIFQLSTFNFHLSSFIFHLSIFHLEPRAWKTFAYLQEITTRTRFPPCAAYGCPSLRFLDNPRTFGKDSMSSTASRIVKTPLAKQITKSKIRWSKRTNIVSPDLCGIYLISTLCFFYQDFSDTFRRRYTPSGSVADTTCWLYYHRYQSRHRSVVCQAPRLPQTSQSYPHRAQTGRLPAFPPAAARCSWLSISPH